MIKKKKKTTFKNFDRLNLSVLFFICQGFYITIIIVVVVIIIKTLALLLAFVIMLRHSQVYQIKQRKKLLRKKFFVGTFRVKFGM